MAETAQKNDIRLLERLTGAQQKIKSELSRVIVGQEEIVNNLIITLLCRGHCLLVGVPGLAKTLMISSLSKVLDLSFSRIQFTPDLMPSDIVGTEVIEENPGTGQRSFRFVRGPVFANIILADEINRTPPKTQSALLEAMQEHSVTVQGDTMRLTEPFFVLATQNPIEQEGTYPLPEAQLDRFMFNLWIGYPDRDDEVEIVRRTTGAEDVTPSKIIDAEEIIALQDLVRRIPAADDVVTYAVDLARKTRPTESDAPGFIKEWVKWGAGPRASQYLILGAKARAALEGRFAPSKDDVRSVAMLVLRHRLVTTFAAEAEGISSPGYRHKADRRFRLNGTEQDFLSPEIVSRLSRLDLIARQVVEGYITGLHKSPYHGFSAEFAEHRQYMVGDSLKYLDWKVYGRSDRMYVKRFEEETNLKSHIILDVSGSMGFQDRGAVTKYRYASIIASALAFLMIRQRDSVGLVTFSDTMKSYVPPRSVQSQLKEIMKILSNTKPEGTTVTSDVLHTMAERISARGLVILISDLVVDADEFIHGLKHFRHNGHEVIVFQILDPMELDFDYTTDTRFIDLETGRKITTQPWHIRDQYRSLLDEYKEGMVRKMHDISVDYALLTTDIPFDRALSEYLAKRKRLY